MVNIPNSYFETYGGDSGKPYSDSFKLHTVDVDDLVLALNQVGFWPESCYDIGAADGSMLLHLNNTFHFREVSGCEINRDIIKEAAPELRDNISCFDVMRNPQFFKTYDLVVANISMYLKEADFSLFLKHVKRLAHKNTVFCFVNHYDIDGGYFYLSNKGFISNGIAGSTYMDRYRKLNKPYVWYLSALESSGYGVFFVSEDGVIFARKGKRVKDFKPSYIETATLSELKRKRMINCKSPIKVHIFNRDFYFSWIEHNNTPYLVEYGDYVSKKEFDIRLPYLKAISKTLLDRNNIPVQNFILRPNKFFCNVPRYSTYSISSRLFVLVSDSYITGFCADFSDVSKVIRKSLKQWRTNES